MLHKDCWATSSLPMPKSFREPFCDYLSASRQVGDVDNAGLMAFMPTVVEVERLRPWLHLQCRSGDAPWYYGRNGRQISASSAVRICCIAMLSSCITILSIFVYLLWAKSHCLNWMSLQGL